MKKFHRILICFIMAVLALNVAMAASPGLIVSGCSVTPSSGTVGCGQTITITCRVADANAVGSSAYNQIGVAKVEYGVSIGSVRYDEVLGTGLYSATLLAGTNVNATWTTVINVTPDRFGAGGPYSVNVEAIKVTGVNRNPEVSLFTGYKYPSLNPHYCYFPYTGRLTSSSNNIITGNDQNVGCQLIGPLTGFFTTSVNCSCSQAQSIGSCGIYNNRTVTYSSSYASCQTSAGSVESCDYCDPLWTAYYNNCTITNYTTMTGRSSKDYFHGIGNTPNGSTCCDRTVNTIGQLVFNHNSGSDCVKPADVGLASDCTMDTWLQASGLGTFQSNKYPYDSSNTDHYTVPSLAETGQQTLVYDIDRNGVSDLVNKKGNTIYVSEFDVDSKGYVLKYQINSNTTLVGNPVIVDVSVNQPERDYYCRLPNCAARILVPASNGSINKLALFSYSGGSITQSLVSLPAGEYLGSNPTVSCYQNYCYMTTYDSSGGIFFTKFNLANNQFTVLGSSAREPSAGLDNSNAKLEPDQEVETHQRNQFVQRRVEVLQ